MDLSNMFTKKKSTICNICGREEESQEEEKTQEEQDLKT